MKLTILELIILAAAYAFIGYSVFVLWQLFAYAGVRALPWAAAKMAEADLMRLLQRLASQLGARLFRQNVGQAWVGKVEHGFPGKRVMLGKGDIVIRNARPFHAGVAGMSDLGGWMPVEVTADMIGSTVALYVQVEVKDGARPTKEQTAWIEAVNKAGGRAGVAHNESELAQIIRGKR